MKIFLGPIHPHLENALVGEIRDRKPPGSLVPLLVLVPSDSLRRRIKVLLVRERGYESLNLHVLTFYQLSLRLYAELTGKDDPLLSSDPLWEEVLRQVLRAGIAENGAFAGIREKAGGCAALWQTLRDLKDGMVDSERVLEALQEGLLGRGENGKAIALFSLFRTVQESSTAWGLRDYADLDRLILDHVAASNFLGQFPCIFYYGFYDLTQVQIDLFQTIARRYPVTLFFPLVRGHPAWSFAQKFYERYLQGLASKTNELCSWPRSPESRGRLPLPLFLEERITAERIASDHARIFILSCFGARDEVSTTAKEILRLVSEEGMAYHEIGVVARNLDAYAPWIKEVFSEHCIPVNGSIQESLSQFPLVKMVCLLLSLSSKDFLRAHFVELISSPFFRLGDFCPSGLAPRPDLWDVLTRRLGITKGVEGWSRLEQRLGGDVEIIGGEEDGDRTKVSVSAEQVKVLWNLFKEIYQDLSRMPAEASWNHYASTWKRLLEKYLGISEAGKQRDLSHEEAVRDGVLAVLEGLARMDCVHPRVGHGYFIEAFQRWLGRSSVKVWGANRSGVTVTDVMSARGLSFRAFFILGLNEGVFPRTIREDAFLRDSLRRSLETVLGYKVSEKLGGFDEEKLLFTLLAEAAGERLYCLYQRSDDSGRPLPPSWYLAELSRALQGTEAVLPLPETNIPRGILEKQEVPPFHRPEWLPPEELATRMILLGQDPHPAIERFAPAVALYEHARGVLSRLEGPGGRMGAYDGITGSLADFWDRLRHEGISPTALERYAQCPFQFFACQVLHLRRLDQPEAMAGVAPLEIGKLVHEILRRFYEELPLRKPWNGEVETSESRSLLEEAARKVFAGYRETFPVGYPLLWEVLQEYLMDLLRQVVLLDLQEMAQSGYRPCELEKEGKSRVEVGGSGELGSFPIHGRMDRIDHDPTNHRYRVIDYKLKVRDRAADDRNLLRSAIRGRRLQPPFYILLGRQVAAQRGEPGAGVDAALYFLAPSWEGGPLVREVVTGELWEGPSGNSLRETLAILFQGIRAGRFFIDPGRYCRTCEVSEVCRKNHLPTYWRSENDPLAERFREVKRKNPTKEKVQKDES